MFQRDSSSDMNRTAEGDVYRHQSAIDFKWIINQQINDCRRALNIGASNMEDIFTMEGIIDNLSALLVQYIRIDEKSKNIYAKDLEAVKKNGTPRVLDNGKVRYEGEEYSKLRIESMKIKIETKRLRKKFEALISLATRSMFIVTGEKEDEIQ